MLAVGFIGTGNMGGALARAVAKSGEYALLLANRHLEKAMRLSEEIGGYVVDNSEIWRRADYIFLGVKPGMVPAVLEEALPFLAARERPPVLVSMAAGVSVQQLDSLTQETCPIIRILPNIPVSVGEGVTLYTANDKADAEQLASFRSILSCSGELVALDEELFDAGSAVSGCGGAFLALFLEGLADGAVACGLPRKQAYTLAGQMARGAAKWLLDNDQLPTVLKDATCSPGGTTIRGVRALEKAGVRSAAMEAVIEACGGLD